MDAQSMAKLLYDAGKLTPERIRECQLKGWLPAPDIEDETEALSFAREKKRLELKAARDSQEASGIEISSMTIQTDPASQAKITGAALAALDDPTYTCQWKTADGFVALDVETLKSVARAVRAHVQAAFDHEAECLALVDVAATVEEVEAVKW